MSLDTEYASASASLREASPDQTDPESQYIRLDGAATEVSALLDIEHSVPPGQDASVVSAILYLYKAASWSGAADITFTSLDESWDPYSATYNNQPAVRAESVVVTVATAGAVGDEIAVDITSLIETAVAADDAAGSRWYGVRITSSASGQRPFYSPLGPEEYRPKLVREYNVAPEAPEIVGPSDGQAVSELKPILVGSFFDEDGEDYISAIQVRVDDVDTFASPHYTSTKAAHTEPVFDTNSPPSGAGAMSNLTAGTTYYWQMQVWDSHDVASGWSDTAEFTVVVKGALTLTTPASSTVTTPVPTITHALSVVTQEEVEVEIEHLEDGVWFTHWEVPRYASTATSHTVPDDYALEEGEDYRVTVRAWDTENRADLPGDRDYYEVSQEFTVTAAS